MVKKDRGNEVGIYSEVKNVIRVVTKKKQIAIGCIYTEKQIAISVN